MQYSKILFVWYHAITKYPSSFRAMLSSILDMPKKYLTHHHHEMAAAFPSEPLERLGGEFSVYECLLEAAMACSLQLWDGEGQMDVELSTLGKAWRRDVKLVEHHDFSLLQNSKPMLQRAHHVLAYLVHFYVHSTPGDGVVVIPKSICIPLLAVSKRLGIAPILTYADAILWNWTFVEGSDESLSISNMEFPTLFNSTCEAREDEEEFYRGCAAIEIRSSDSTIIMVDILRLVDDLQFLAGDDHGVLHRKLISRLHDLLDTVQDFTSLLLSLKQGCRPEAFYKSIRPWFRGFDPEHGRGWVYEGIDCMGDLALSGPSAGQTPAIHAIDALLGVEHGPDSHAFMDDALRYMPEEQRAMIIHLRSQAPGLRQLMEQSPEVRNACGEILMALADFRSEHLKIAVRYIVNPKRSMGPLVCPVTGKRAGSAHSHDVKSRGTGGNELSRLLKASRDATKKLAASALVN